MTKHYLQILIAVHLFIYPTASKAESGFQFKSLREIPVLIKIVDREGNAIPSARLSISTPHLSTRRKKLVRQSQSHQVFFNGLSNKDGTVRGTVRIPNHIKRIALSVVKPGYRGRYSSKKLRKLWGPTAPALYLSKKLSRKQKATSAIDLRLRLRSYDSKILKGEQR